MCDISVGDEVVETEDYRKSMRNRKCIHGTVIDIDKNEVATIRLYCGCKDTINTHWLQTVRKYHHCCHHHHCCH